MAGMQLEESFDADAILREPGDNIEEKKEEEEEIEELDFGNPDIINDMDVPDEEDEIPQT